MYAARPSGNVTLGIHVHSLRQYDVYGIQRTTNSFLSRAESEPAPSTTSCLAWDSTWRLNNSREWHDMALDYLRIGMTPAPQAAAAIRRALNAPSSVAHTETQSLETKCRGFGTLPLRL